MQPAGSQANSEASGNVKLYIIISTQIDKKGKINSLTTKNCDKIDKFQEIKNILVQSLKCDNVPTFAHYQVNSEWNEKKCKCKRNPKRHE